jgi:hypothetical protein
VGLEAAADAAAKARQPRPGRSHVPKIWIAFTAALALLPVLAVAQPAITNGSFDTPNVGPCPNFQFKPTGAAWVFSTANDAGITTGGCGQKYTAPALPSGATQAGFIQTAGPNAGTISQTVSGFVAGQNYTITFYAAGRPAGAGCFDNCTELNFSVLVGQTDVLDVVNPPTNAFQQYTTKPFTASGDVTITFEATNPTSTDETSFITLVSIQGGSGPPPPAEPVIANPAFGTPSVGLVRASNLTRPAQPGSLPRTATPESRPGVAEEITTPRRCLRERHRPVSYRLIHTGTTHRTPGL